MASRRKEISEDAKFQIMRLISENPNISTRKIASKVTLRFFEKNRNNGAILIINLAFYLLNSLIGIL